MPDLFLDSSVLLYAAGRQSRWREACRHLVRLAADGEVALHGSVECGQEFLFHRLRQVGLPAAVADFDDVDAYLTGHAFTPTVLLRDRDLVERGEARGRDAVHAATALAGFTSIVSTDSDFEGVSGLRRLDPADLTA